MLQMQTTHKNNVPNQQALTHIYRKMLLANPNLKKIKQEKFVYQMDSEFVSWDGNVYTYSY